MIYTACVRYVLEVNKRRISRLPRRHGQRETEEVVAAAIPVVADSEPAGSEEADVDASTARVLVDATNIIILEESFSRR